MEVLSTSELTFSYPDFRDFKLETSPLSFASGSLTALMGPNGCGKTTLLRILAGLLRPLNGELLLEGRNIRCFNRKERSRKIAFVPQSTHYVFPFTVLDLVQMGRYPHRGLLGSENTEDHYICEKALESCHAIELKNRLIQELSGGEQQRVLLASALAQEPIALLLDEPATGLDISHQLLLFNLLERLANRKKLCIICAFHDMNTATRFFKRIVLLEKGRIRSDGIPVRVLTPHIIKSVYGVRLKQIRIPGGGIFFTPSSRSCL